MEISPGSVKEENLLERVVVFPDRGACLFYVPEGDADGIFTSGRWLAGWLSV